MGTPCRSASAWQRSPSRPTLCRSCLVHHRHPPSRVFALLAHGGLPHMHSFPPLPAAVSYATSTLDGVHDTMAGEAGNFTVQAKDAFGNAFWTSPPASFRPWVRTGVDLHARPALTIPPQPMYCIAHPGFDRQRAQPYRRYRLGRRPPPLQLRHDALRHIRRERAVTGVASRARHRLTQPHPSRDWYASTACIQLHARRSSSDVVLATLARRTCTAPVSAAHSFVLPEFEYDTGMATHLTYFEIQLTDAFGNNYTTGGAHVHVLPSGASCTIT